MSKVLLLDCETTGVSNSDQIIELAYVELQDLRTLRESTHYLGGMKPGTIFNEQYQPSVPIHSKALEIHGIGFKQLLGKRKSEEVEIPKDVTILVGHNISFDHRMLGKPEVLLICTLDLSKKMAKYLDYEVPDHKLDTLAELFKPGCLQTLPNSRGEFHSALGDVWKNIIVLQALLEKLPNINSWEELYSFQQSLKAKPKKEKK